jgi:3-phosphoshikimate 1-carboxyvinyltransferase
MGHFRVRKASLKGEITIPSSKSQTLRSILFASLGCGKSMIHQYLPSTDSFAMIEACRLLGAKVDVFPSKIVVNGVNGMIEDCKDVINAGNSGIILRFCSAVGALASHPIVITGDDSIQGR